MSPKVIIFGPTGAVGSAAAREAQKRGAKVILAMRDTQKLIPGITASQEAAGGYERIKSDLSDARSVESAVVKTGAKYAFIYCMLGTSDGMAASIAALKAGGVEFVAVLSSFAVEGDPRHMESSDFIAMEHARVEVKLMETFGTKGYAAVRPAYFASNLFWWRKTFRAGAVRVVFPDQEFDWIAPGDIGSVCGAILARGADSVSLLDENNAVVLVGPELVSLRDAFQIVNKALGTDVKFTGIEGKDGLEMFMKDCGLPEAVAQSILGQWTGREEAIRRGSDPFYGGGLFEKEAGNVQEHIGREATRLQKWLEENKEAFLP